MFTPRRKGVTPETLMETHHADLANHGRGAKRRNFKHVLGQSAGGEWSSACPKPRMPSGRKIASAPGTQPTTFAGCRPKPDRRLHLRPELFGAVPSSISRHECRGRAASPGNPNSVPTPGLNAT
jgi:hypothetical protein